MKNTLVPNSKSSQIIEKTGFVGSSEYWIAVRKMVLASRNAPWPFNGPSAIKNARLSVSRHRFEMCLWMLLRRSKNITPRAVKIATNKVVRAHENLNNGSLMSEIFK